MPSRDPIPSLIRLALVLVLTGLAVGSARGWPADRTPRDPLLKWTLPVPVPFAYPLPDWLEVPVQEYGSGTNTLSVPVYPPPGDAELVVTIYFNEARSGLIRVVWDDGVTAVTLARNLVEGVGGPHRRSLLLSRDILYGAGVLSILSVGEAAPVYQIEFEWVAPDAVSRPVTGADDLPEYELSHGRVPGHAELSGDPYRPLADEWEGDIISAPLTNRIERIDDGLIFVAPLEEAPSQVRVAVWITGLPVTGEIRLLVNGRDAGPVAFHVPDLADHGYYQDEAGTWWYAGWRKGVIAVDEAFFSSGDNEIELVEAREDSPVPVRPLAVKDLMLQLRYPPRRAEPPSGEAAGDGVEVRRAVPHIEFLISEPSLLPPLD